MVMENPTAQSVGREFVRQYYTLMHEAPHHLHRFYSHNSNFVHGGVEPPGHEAPPVCGQAEIHRKITSLDFQDCHAKIRQVDSQATVENAVVVQVTGELSNKGQPMRRFMQTFILAPQSPKKYYVMNDIFRYQDEVFQDESDPENEEAQATFPEAEQEPLENGQDAEAREAAPTFLEPTTISNGTGHVEEAAEVAPVKEPEEEKKPAAPEEAAPPQPEEKPEPEPAQPAQEPAEPAAAETKVFSWAAMASKNTPNASAAAQPASIAAVTKPAAPRPEPKVEPRPHPNQEPLPQRTSRPSMGPQRMGGDRENRASATRGEGDGDNDGRRPNLRQYPDVQQLFVGNLPHNVNERDLKTFFENYGPVIEMRINTKSAGGKLPNFGFVVFESAETVQKVLNLKEKQPIKFNGEHRLNIEEKKPRENRMGGGRGGVGRGPVSQTMTRGGMNQSMSRGGMRGGMSRSDNRGGAMAGQPRSGGMMKR